MTKRIYIPGYVRANGFAVKGHYRNMTESKETRSIAAIIGWQKRKAKMYGKAKVRA
ncbi:MAG: hypothetical protein QXS81_01090 [Candidatus Micrarchaeaceae archaeon]